MPLNQNTARSTYVREYTLEEQEQQWIRAIATGDTAAFEELYYAYTPRLYAFAVDFLGREDIAWEVVDDVFIKIWQQRSQWRPRGSLRPYLYQAVRYQIYSHLRKVKLRRRILSVEDPTDSIAVDLTPGDAYEYSEFADAVHQFTNEMPERRRMVYHLHRQHGLTYDEIAQVMGIASKTVENHMAHALRHLREKLSPYFA